MIVWLLALVGVAAFERFVLLAPYLGCDAPTNRSSEGAGWWAAPDIPRIVALTLLDRIGVDWAQSLPAIASPSSRRRRFAVSRCSFRLLANYGPLRDWRGAFAATTKIVLIAGADHMGVRLPVRGARRDRRRRAATLSRGEAEMARMFLYAVVSRSPPWGGCLRDGRAINAMPAPVDRTKIVFKSLMIEGIYDRRTSKTRRGMIAMAQSGLDARKVALDRAGVGAAA